jgi:hypothetical protein
MKSTPPVMPPTRLDEWRTAEPPPAVQAATLAAMRKALARRPHAKLRLPGGPRPSRWLAWSGAALCASGLLGVLLVFGVSLPPARQAEFSASAFVPLVSNERWQRVLQDLRSPGQEPATAWVVPTEIPRERLALLGLPYDPSQAAQPVRAELLMHADGEVLAVRLLR